MLGRQRDILEGHPKNKPIFVTLAKAIIKRSASEVHILINTAVACSVAYTILFQLNTFPFTKSISFNSCLIYITFRTFHSPPHFPVSLMSTFLSLRCRDYECPSPQAYPTHKVTFIARKASKEYTGSNSCLTTSGNHIRV